MLGQLRIKVKNLLTMGENTVGISFTDTAIYCAIPDRKNINSVAHFVEYKIEEGVVEGGIVKDYDKFALSTKNALSELKSSATFSVLSVPSTLIFSNIIHIPNNIGKDDVLKKAIDLVLNVELPWKKDDAYTDYVIHNTDKDICVSIFSIPKKIANSYIAAVENTGTKVLALEFDAMSSQRLMKQHDEYTLSITATSTHANIIIMKKNIIDFIFSMQMSPKFNKDAILGEVSRIKNYYSTETGVNIESEETPLELTLESTNMLGENISNINFYPALGSAMRTGFLEGKDNNISLLQMLPNELYRYFRFESCLKLIKQSTILVSIILICIHVLFFSILSQIAARNSVFSSQPPKIYSSVSTIRTETKELNSIINTGGLIADRINRFLPKLLKIDSIITEGIYPSSIVIPEINSPIILTGNASTRTQYNLFRTSISSDSMVKITSFPLGNLNLQTNIPFSVSLNVLGTIK